MIRLSKLTVEVTLREHNLTGSELALLDLEQLGWGSLEPQEKEASVIHFLII